MGTGFHPELTGKENVFLNGAILGMSRKEINLKYDQILEFSGVDKFIHTPVKRYSTGMRVRLAFAVAAFLDPEILLIDEVLAVGDQEFQDKCLNRMDDISKTAGKTIFFVSHNLEAVQRLCDRVILLNGGKIIADGIPSAVIKEYLNVSKKHKGKDLKLSDRNFQAPAWFSSIETVGSISDEPFTVIKGEDLTFKIGVDYSDSIVETKMSLTIKVSDSFVVSRSNQLSIDHVKLINKKRIFNLKIKNLNLNPGIYFLTFWIGTKNKKYDLIKNGTPPLRVLSENKNEKETKGFVNFNYEIF